VEAATASSEAADTNGDDDEINIDDLDEEKEKDTAGLVHNVSTKAVPAAVFSGLTKLSSSEGASKEESVGALERLRSAKPKDQ
jgi:hypothetical protein